jgi:hypothetical protein
MISLQQYRGGRVLLIFSDPHCGPCSQLAPYLVRAYRRRTAPAAEIILISRGDPGENRQKAETYGFEFPVAVQDKWKLSRSYGIFATPVAFLINRNGRTEREVAVGFEQIRALLFEEFKRGPVEGLLETVDDISRILSSSVPRRSAFHAAARFTATALLSGLGLQKIAFSACGTNQTACGSGCCNSSTERCCNAAASLCCSLSLPCCNGKCCAPGEVCSGGQCRQQILP